MKLKDIAATKIQGTARNITQTEYSKAYPDRVPRRLTFYFKKDEAVEFDNKIGNLMIKKYDEIVLAEQPKDDFSEMEKPDLYKLAKSQGCDYDYIGTTREEFIEWLR